jgi:hypothetical protein
MRCNDKEEYPIGSIALNVYVDGTGGTINQLSNVVTADFHRLECEWYNSLVR